MGRYSFFILNFVSSGYNVYAVDGSIDILPSTISGDSDSDSSFIGPIENSGLSNSSGIQQTEIENAESSETVNQEIPEIAPSFEAITPYYDGWFRTIYGGPGNNYWIGGAFSGYSLVPSSLPNSLAINFDILLRATQNSVQATNARVDDVKKHADNINTKYNNAVNSINSNINYANTRISNLESWRKSHDAWAANLLSRVNGHDNSINALANTDTAISNALNSHVNNLQKQITSTNNRVTGHDNSIKALANTDTAISNALNSHVSNLQVQINSTNNEISVLKSQNNAIVVTLQDYLGLSNTLLTNISKATSSINTKMDSVIKTLQDSLGYNNSLLVANNSITKNGFADIVDTLNNPLTLSNGLLLSIKLGIGDIVKTLQDNLSYTNTLLSNGNKDRKNGIDNIVKTLQDSIGYTNALMVSNNSANKKGFNDIISTLNDPLTVSNALLLSIKLGIADIVKTLQDNLSYTNVLLSNGNSTNNKFYKSFTDLFDSNGELGLNANEGKFTSMLKHQFIALRNDIRDLFSSEGTFWTNLKKLFDVYFDINNKDSGFYRIRYSIVAGFGDLEKILELIGTDTLNLRKSLITTNDFLNTMIDWLKLIYEKPTGSVSVTVPPFDFNRLEEILKNLSFGNVVNEAGTNFWDFMKELIKNLGDILTTAIGGVKDVLMRIFDILDKFVDTIIKLIVPDNLDFLDSQWSKTLDTIKLKFSFIFDSVDSVKSIFSGDKKNFEDLDIKLNAGNLGDNSFSLGSVKLPVSYLNTFLIFVKPIANAFVLLWFLIDMYKWIHERNAVVE